MTWKKASPVLIVAAVFDALRYMCLFFWFFGPAMGALLCTVAGSSTTLGKLVGTTATGAACTFVAGAAGIAGFPIVAALGTVMAIAVGFLGWLTVTALIFMMDSRTFKENPVSALWLFEGIGASVFIMAWGVYRAQIKIEKAALYKWQKVQKAAQLQERQQQAAQLMQYQQYQEAQAALDQEAINETVYEDRGEEEIPDEVHVAS